MTTSQSRADQCCCVKPAPLVSIVMPCFGMGEFISEALQGIATQTFQNWELIAVDDSGPEDGTRSYVESFADENPDKRISYLRHEQNQGVSAARNSGIASASGEFIALLDPDDLWREDHLINTVERLVQNPDLGIVCSPVEVFENTDNAQTEHKAIGRWQRDTFPASLACFNFIQPSATVIRKSAMDKVGLFSTDPSIQHIEDYDYWIRMVEANIKFAFMEAPTCLYRKHPQGATSDEPRMRDLHQYLFAKHARFITQMRGQLISRALNDSRQALDQIGSIRNEVPGPIIRMLQRIDSSLQRLKRWLF